MGNLCCGPPSTAESRMIDQNMGIAYDLEKKTTKLLLLGTGNAGKSTFFRQFQFLYGEGIGPEERKNYLEQIQQQCIDQMKHLAAGCTLQATAGNAELKLSEEADQAYNRLCMLDNKAALDEDTIEILKILWGDEGIRNGFELRAKLCIPESSGFFWDHIERIGAIEYSPTNEDIVLLRAPTNGITSVQFQIEGQLFEIVDVGGQRSERKKWINVFDNVTGILWVASLSSYDEVLFEDHSANAMMEQLKVFEETINIPSFEQTSVILFLNKVDLFQEKFEHVSIKICFPEYDGAEDYLSAVEFIKKQFRARNRTRSRGRDLYLHVTCATDNKNVEKVFTDVTHTIVHNALADARIL